MAETTHITVAETSDGPDDTVTSGTEVSLPVVEILTGRGFVTGKSGSGKSNSASVIAEKLLDSGFGLLIVDIDGEYYGLKEEYEILHVGGDEECDIQVTTDHAEKIASLALEQNVPIILDVSSYLDENEAEELLTVVTRSLFSKAKKQKQPFLLLVEEVHEYIPENGSVGECGKMLIKIGKRGRKHGLGICGISQRPADVKKDFITQCDWLLWHRLTWNNDTKVVQRILDADYANAVENLDNGEGFLMTDWSEQVKRVQFFRKQTFDAGATPGLDDFERPELKSVSDDLVSELEAISEEQVARENRITELREELDRKNSRIAELEAELQDARDMSRMADQFVNALVEHVEGPAPGRTERERMRRTLDEETRRKPAPGAPAAPAEPTANSDSHEDGTSVAAETTVNATDSEDDGLDGAAHSEVLSAIMEMDDETVAQAPERSSERRESDIGQDTEESRDDHTEPVASKNTSRPFSAERVLGELRSVSELTVEDVRRDNRPTQTAREQIESTLRNDAEIVVDEDDPEPLAVRELKADIGALETKTRKMLAFYREFGPSTPLNAHFAAGGDGDRTDAYAHNRELRTRGLIEHVGRGHYEYRVRDRLGEELGSHIDDEVVDAYVAEIEATAGL